MPQRTLPAAIQNLLELAQSTAHGLARHEPSSGLARIPAEEFRSAMQQLRDSETRFSNARSAKVLARQRATIADKILQRWLAKARLVVMLARGTRWAESRTDTGFGHRGISRPKSLDGRIALARSLVSFFARHPELGVGFADVTAAQGRGIYERAIQSREFLQVMAGECTAIKQQRDAAKEALRGMLREVVRVLSETMDGGDPRWLDFGLKQRKSQTGRSARIRYEQQTSRAPVSFQSRAETEARNAAAA